MQENLSLLTENDFGSSKLDTKKGKDYYIEGVFLQGNILNRNKRIYPTEILEKSVEEFNKKIDDFGMVAGELSHPSHTQIDPDRISHYITSLKMDGNNGIGRAKIGTTPKGNIVRNLIDDGFKIAVSTRGLGQVGTNKTGQTIVENFNLVTVDIVTEPSAPDAYVESIMESIKFMIDDNNEIKVQSLENLLENISKKLEVLPKKLEEKNNKYSKIIHHILDTI